MYMDYRKDLNTGDAILVNFVNLSEPENENVRVWRNHESIRKWMYQEHEISRQEHSAFLAGLRDDTKNYYWLVKTAANEYVGVVSINRLDIANRNAYLGIYANPEVRVKGAGKLLIHCLKYIAFEFIKLHTLKLEVIATNERTVGFYRHSGFRDEGVLREFVYKESRWLDVFIMGMINGEK